MNLTFKGGVHPLKKIHEGKPLTANSEITPMQPGEIVKIPMSQHVGAPAKPIVAAGDAVKVGQMIGEAAGFVSAPVHSSVSGTVKEVASIMGIMGKPVQAVVIENDFQDETSFMEPVDWEHADKEAILNRIGEAGIVGMGGATFPTRVKLSPPKDKEVNLLILNGAECEPFLTADYRLMVEKPEQVLTGVAIMMKALDVKKAIVGIEDNKPEAIRKMTEAASGTHAIRVVPLVTKYPQGSEKQLIEAITGRIVPSGGLPMDAGAVVSNVGTANAVAQAFSEGKPLYERIVTVTGAVKSPQNLLVRIGVSTEEVLSVAGGFSTTPLKIISGGPMMGLPYPSLECVITKGASGVLVLDKTLTKFEKQTNCIKCGKCAYACPMFLRPMVLSAAAVFEDVDRAKEYNAMDCINCGCCSFVCPAKIPIAQNIKFAKDMIALDRIKQERLKEREAADEKKRQSEK